MLNAEITKRDLFKACESLFGTDVDVSVEFLRYLKPSGIKAAFRKKAMETHPDRAVMLAGEVVSLEMRFKEVNLAYQLLMEFLAHPWKYQLDEYGTICRSRRPGKPPAKRDYKPAEETRYQGRIPARSLLLGQFLYYSGYVSLSTLIKAIVWQRLQRPAIGSIAAEWDLLVPQNVVDILRARRYGEKFGECALRCGYISKYQLMLLLNRQKTMQPQIGRYFVEQGIITSLQLYKMIEEMKKHNRKFWTRNPVS